MGKIYKFLSRLPNKEEKWWQEGLGYLKILFWTTIIFCCCRIMKAIGMDASYVDTLETIDKGGTVVVGSFFVLTLVRRALARFLND